MFNFVVCVCVLSFVVFGCSGDPILDQKFSSAEFQRGKERSKKKKENSVCNCSS